MDKVELRLPSRSGGVQPPPMLSSDSIVRESHTCAFSCTSIARHGLSHTFELLWGLFLGTQCPMVARRRESPGCRQGTDILHRPSVSHLLITVLPAVGASVGSAWGPLQPTEYPNDHQEAKNHAAKHRPGNHPMHFAPHI